MKRKLTGREQVMIVLLAVAAVIAYRFLSGDGIGFGGTAEEEKAARDFGTPPVVRMDLLDTGHGDFDPGGRNLFAYYVPPPPPREAPPQREQAPRPAPPPRATPPPPRQPTKPRAPKPDFSYLGYLGPKDERIAVFDAGSNGVNLARVGDLVGEQYRLLEFKHEGVMLSYTDPRWEGVTTELLMAGAR